MQKQTFRLKATAIILCLTLKHNMHSPILSFAVGVPYHRYSFRGLAGAGLEGRVMLIQEVSFRRNEYRSMMPKSKNYVKVSHFSGW